MGTSRFSGMYRFRALFGGDWQSALSRYMQVPAVFVESHDVAFVFDARHGSEISMF